MVSKFNYLFSLLFKLSIIKPHLPQLYKCYLQYQKLQDTKLILPMYIIYVHTVKFLYVCIFFSRDCFIAFSCEKKNLIASTCPLYVEQYRHMHSEGETELNPKQYLCIFYNMNHYMQTISAKTK